MVKFRMRPGKSMLVDSGTIGDLIRELEDRDNLLSSFYNALISKPTSEISVLEANIRNQILNFYGDKIEKNLKEESYGR